MNVHPIVHHVVCNCNSSDHIVQFCHLDDMEEDELCWVEVQLHQYRSFFKRLVVAVKYLFGYKCRYGHWDCTTLNVVEGKALVAYLNKAIEDKEKI